jgi:hypothetical protein
VWDMRANYLRVVSSYDLSLVALRPPRRHMEQGALYLFSSPNGILPGTIGPRKIGRVPQPTRTMADRRPGPRNRNVAHGIQEERPPRATMGNTEFRLQLGVQLLTPQ